MNILDLQNKLIAVLGYGVEGKATAEYLLKHGVRPVLFDHKPWEQWSQPDQEAVKQLGLSVVFGPDCFKELPGFQVAFRSPGIRLLGVELQGWINQGLTITSQAKFFFDNCPAKIVGVTGTKGKGTTATLITEIVRARNKESGIQNSVYLTGNIGAVQPLDILDQLVPEDIVVYEMSSFQLQDLHKSPHVGVVLMVTEEHLDYHKDEAEYVDAKGPILKYQSASDFAVINADFKNSVAIGREGRGGKVYFSRTRELESGCFVRGNELIYKLPDGTEQVVVQKNELQLRGDHNLENVAAATLAATILHVPLQTIRQAVKNFTGLEHRLEFVVEKNGVKYYNDSFSTTPETAIAAIKAFTEPEVVILGGSSKNSDFTELGKTIAKSSNIKALILIGQEADRIQQSVEAAGNFPGKILEGAKTMPEIVALAASVATPGDVVVLSPACASFGMFENYKDRGRQFKEEVEKMSN